MLTRREFLAAAVMAAGIPLAACGQDASQAAQTEEVADTEASAPADEEDIVNTFELEVGGKVFSGSLAETEVGEELASRLPLTLDMSELAGNEKYCFTQEEFPGGEETPSELHAGEIWIYSDDCIVLFYKDHANPGYDYKFAGSLDDASGLEEAVGTGDVQVTIR